jgi:hypothetical protein
MGDVKIPESDHAPVSAEFELPDGSGIKGYDLAFPEGVFSIAKHCNEQSPLEADGDPLCHPRSPL